MNDQNEIISKLTNENSELKRRLCKLEDRVKEIDLHKTRLKQKQIELATLLNHIPAMIFLKDIDSNYITATDNFCRQLGTTVDEIVGKTDSSFYNPDLAKMYHESDLLTIQSGSFIDIGEEEITIDNQKRTFSSKKVLVKDETDLPIGILGLAFDITKQKEAERRLAESEERYRTFISQTSDGIYRLEMKVPIPIKLPVDEQIKLIYKHAYIAECNDSFALMYGYDSSSHLTGKKLIELHGTDSNETNLNEFRKYIKNDYKITNSETIEINISGEPIYIMNNSIGIIVNERLTNIWGTQTNITDKKMAEVALQNSEIRYRNLFKLFRLMADNMPDLLWAKDMNRNFIFTNKAICEKLLNSGNTDEPLGKNEMYFVNRERNLHPESANWFTFGEDCFDSDSIVMKSGKVGRFDEFGNVMGKFLYLDVQKAPIIDDEGKMIGTVGSARDVTEKKKIEKELNNTLIRNKAILEALPDLMFLYDKNGYLHEVHAHDKDELLAPAEMIIGHHISEFFSPELSKKVIDLIALALNEKTIESFEYNVNLKDGINFYEARFVPVNEDHVLSISRNITDRKRMEHDLLQAKNVAEASDRLKTALLMNMSHELRTPMNGILGFAELLKDSVNEEELKDMTINIINSGKRLMDTLDSIMELSQLESGIKQPEFNLVNVGDLISKLLLEYTDLAVDKHLELFFKPSDKTFVLADHRLLNKAIAHLVDNAFKFTISGYIKIELNKTRKDKEKFVQIIIEDTGIGIATEFHDVIFEEFHQVSQGYSRSYEGVGLGLTLARKIIYLMNGSIRLMSQLHKGSTFIITLPVVDITTSEQQTKPVKDEKSVNTVYVPNDFTNSPVRKILLVEDNIVNLNLLVAYLRGQYFIDVASNAQTALEKVSSTVFDAIIMDINLGSGEDGLTIAKKIRSDKRYFDTPIIAATGYTLYGEKETLLEGGCTHYLPKPFKKQELLDILSEIFKK